MNFKETYQVQSLLGLLEMASPVQRLYLMLLSELHQKISSTFFYLLTPLNVPSLWF